MTRGGRLGCAAAAAGALIVVVAVASTTSLDAAISDRIFGAGGSAWPASHSRGWLRWSLYEGPKYLLAIGWLGLLVAVAWPRALPRLRLSRAEAIYLLVCLASVPLVIGYTADEASCFVGLLHPAGGEFGLVGDETVTAEEMRATLERSYPSPGHVDRLMAAYPGLAGLEERAVIDHLGDHMFGVHVDHVSRLHAKAGHPVYRYHFRAVPASPKQTAGAFHAADVLYVFDTSFPLVPDADDKHLLAADMGDRWFAFAATGVPDSPGRPSWPVYDPGDPLQMVFDRPRSHVGPCPPEPGLDVMRERIEWLTATLSG